jgi:hypothetical protein
VSGEQSPSAATAGSTPSFRFVHGRPTAEEIAAVVTVLSARAAAGSGAPEQDKPQSGWAAYWRGVRAPLRPGPGRWQAAVRNW